MTARRPGATAPVIEVTDFADLQALRAKIAAGANVNRRVGFGRDDVPLGIAAGRGDVDACRVLLEAGAKPNLGKHPAVSPLCLLVKGRYLRAVRGEPAMALEDAAVVATLLVQYGCSVDGVKERGSPQYSWQLPLYEAANVADRAMVSLLADLGADLNRSVRHIGADGSFRREVRDESVLALLQPRVRSDAEIAETTIALLRAGADDTCLGDLSQGVSAFQFAVKTGQDRLVEFYVKERGEDLSQSCGGVPLERLAWNESTRQLLRALKVEQAIASSLSGPSSSADSPSIARSVRRAPTL